MKEEILEVAQPFVQAGRIYHQHKVIGMENIPATGRALLVVTHSLATYDISFLFAAIYEELGRLCRPLADNFFFNKAPYLGELVEAIGGKQGSKENALSLLENEQLVMVAPGGMREALRPSSERYQILWDKRKGFIRIALQTQTPIILAVCPKADDIFDVYKNGLTKLMYQKFRIPLVFARGLGLTPLPRPVKLFHFLSEPIIPPKPKDDPQAFARQVNRLHKKVTGIAQDLIGKAIAYRE